jgi:hypothetical protein
MSDETPTPQLPEDVTDVAVLRQMLGVPPAIHESVTVLLADRGRLFAFRAGVRPTLAGKADYLAALGEFCERVPAAAGFMADQADRRARFMGQDRVKAVNERHVQAQLDEMTGKGVQR